MRRARSAEHRPTALPAGFASAQRLRRRPARDQRAGRGEPWLRVAVARRLQDDSGNATHIENPFGEGVIINLSVWESVEALRDLSIAPITSNTCGGGESGSTTRVCPPTWSCGTCRMGTSLRSGKQPIVSSIWLSMEPRNTPHLPRPTVSRAWESPLWSLVFVLSSSRGGNEFAASQETKNEACQSRREALELTGLSTSEAPEGLLDGEFDCFADPGQRRWRPERPGRVSVAGSESHSGRRACLACGCTRRIVLGSSRGLLSLRSRLRHTRSTSPSHSVDRRFQVEPSWLAEESSIARSSEGGLSCLLEACVCCPPKVFGDDPKIRSQDTNPITLWARSVRLRAATGSGHFR
jgi:hypothetical protein